jgi:hypothetical protein
VGDILNEHYLDCWTGCGSPTSPEPLSWPPHSPDLTTPDNSLWGIIKEEMAAHRYHNSQNLHRAALTTIMPQMLWQISHTWKLTRLFQT